MHKPPWTFGFRPFFLLASVTAALLPAAWMLVWQGFWPAPPYYPPMLWHGHEMIFGYLCAVLAGFFLTAVHNWTGLPTVHGTPLALLCLLWLLGRLCPLFPLPATVIMVVDVAFVPCLLLGIAIPILRKRMWRNLGWLPILLALALLNLALHLGLDGTGGMEGHRALGGSLDLILLIFVWVFGRIYPFFANRVLPQPAITKKPWLEALSLATVIALCAFHLWLPAYAPHLAAFAALVHGLRLAGFYRRKIWRVPLVWIMWVGYAWLVLGLAFEGAALYLSLPPLVSRHLYSAGALGMITLGMIVRVSLGHTGRPLKVDRPVIGLFVTANLAVFFRVFPPILLPEYYVVWMFLSATCWVATFTWLTLWFTPIWLSPRPDGKPG